MYAFSASLLLLWLSALHILALSTSLGSELSPRLSKTAMLQVGCASWIHNKHQSDGMRHLTCFPSPGNHSLALTLVQHQNPVVSYILCRYVFTVDRYSNTSSSTVTRSRSEFPIHFYFPLMLPSETYPKTVFYSLLCILLFFFLSPPSSAYHLPKYLAFKS